MKFIIVFCLLVVLACHEAVGNNQRALLEGDCKPEDVSADQLSACILLKCKKESGIWLLTREECPPICIDQDDPNGYQSGDPNKPYPDCCPKSSKNIESARRVACT